MPRAKDAIASRSLIVAWSLVALAGPPGAVVAAPIDATAARAALEQTRDAYRRAAPFQEVLDFVLELPDGRREPRQHQYGLDASGNAYLTLSAGDQVTITIVARDGRMIGTQFNVDSRYAEVPYDGDFAAALARLGGEQAQLTAPAAIVAAQGGDAVGFVNALRLGVLSPLAVTGGRTVESADGTALVEVDLRAANGAVTIGVDGASLRLRTLAAALGQGDQQVRAVGSFRSAEADFTGELALPDLTGRTAVPTLAALQAGEYPLGTPAPDLTLPSLAGVDVRLADHEGSVIVLDFWATWCVPCWTALEHTAELAAWAERSGLAVEVFAVDTLESSTGVEEQRRQAMQFLRAKGIEVPVLLDVDHRAFAAFHSPGLPSVVIVGPDGRLASYHPGLLPEMTATLRGEIEKLAGR